MSCSEDGSCLLYDWRAQRVVRRWEGHTRGVNAVVYAPHSQEVVTAGRDLELRRWSTSDTACAPRNPRVAPASVMRCGLRVGTRRT